MNKKSDYITQSEIDKITVAIFNDNIETLYKDVPKVIESNFVTPELKEVIGELEYAHIEGMEHYIVIEDGRIINTQRITRMTTQWTGSEIRAYCTRKKVILEDEFIKNGWDYDTYKILKNYKVNKWPIRLGDPQREVFDNL